jgi:hypothetical protein
MRKSLFFWDTHHALGVVVMPWVIRECVAVRKNVMLPHSNNLSKDGGLSASLPSDNKGPAMFYRFNVSLVVLKG